ncbi:type II toxin -antitoxin system TacA 1-like antitoxin [Pectobacterium brasiliense]|uniref:type II toxin -antitoxin system TacA 1-like antitoxin n=1 Tax=Pectobacterium brasiliense TaxID=180957 RepID=UPI0039888B34
MPATNSVSAKRETLNLRIKPAERDLIAQYIIMADPDAYQEFLVRLDQAPAPNAALRKTMQTPAPWEQKK